MADLFRVIDDVVFGCLDLRIAERLLLLADGAGDVSVTHQSLADELGTAREVVSRQIREFQQRGWVEQERGCVRLVDAVALQRFADSGQASIVTPSVLGTRSFFAGRSVIKSLTAASARSMLPTCRISKQGSGQ